MYYYEQTLQKFKNITFDRYINYLIMAYAFTLPITIAGINLFGHLIILSYLFRGNFKNALTELKQSKFIVILFFFILLSIISVIWSEDKVAFLIYIKKYWHFLTIPVIYLAFNTKYIKHVFTSFFLGILVNIILFYCIFFELFDAANYPGIFNALTTPNDPSPFMNHSNYSLYLSFSSIILINLVFFTDEMKHKVFYICCFIATTSSLFMSGGRAGQVIFVITLITILLLNFKNKIKGFVIGAMLTTLVLVTAYQTSSTFKDRGNQAYTDVIGALIHKDYSGSFGERVSLWIMGANVFNENIMLGTSLGEGLDGMKKYAYKYNVTRYQDRDEKGHVDYHNLYIQHAVTLGLPGLLLVIYLMYSLFVMKFKSAMYRNLNIAFAVTIFILSTVSNIFGSIFPFVFFAFFVAILSAISKSEIYDEKGENSETR